jgi:hypothetical protein
VGANVSVLALAQNVKIPHKILILHDNFREKRPPQQFKEESGSAHPSRPTLSDRVRPTSAGRTGVSATAACRGPTAIHPVEDVGKSSAGSAIEIPRVDCLVPVFAAEAFGYGHEVDVTVASSVATIRHNPYELASFCAEHCA